MRCAVEFRVSLVTQAVGNVWAKGAVAFDTTETVRMQAKTIVGSTFSCVEGLFADSTEISRFLHNKYGAEACTKTAFFPINEGLKATILSRRVKLSKAGSTVT